jgi:hypothetical protein
MGVRLIFVAVALAFVVQLAVTAKVGEPYPALAMPAFRGTGNYWNRTVRAVRLEAKIVAVDGRTETVERAALLGSLPTSAHTTIDIAFLRPYAAAEAARVRAGAAPARDPSRIAPDRRSATTPLRFRLFPGLKLGARRRRDPQHVAAVRAWLAERARALAPDLEVERMELRWHVDTFRMDRGMTPVAREIMISVTVPVAGPR